MAGNDVPCNTLPVGVYYVLAIPGVTNITVARGREARKHRFWRKNRVWTSLGRLWKEESGQDLVEYGLLLALIAVGAIASAKTLSNAIHNVFAAAATNMTTS